MRSIRMLVPVAVLFGAVVVAASEQQPAPATGATQASVKPIDVPQGNGAPVITDGIFSRGEWDDAERIDVDEGVTLYVKEWRGVVFIGLRGQGQNGIGPSELSLGAPGGPIEKLHVSFGLAQVVLPPTGPEPRMRVGLTTEWYANEFRRDEEEFARLQKEGKDPREIMRATSYPSDGIEFAIRRSKFPGPVWMMRLWASAVVGGKPGMVTYPPAAAERTMEGWLQLRFK